MQTAPWVAAVVAAFSLVALVICAIAWRNPGRELLKHSMPAHYARSFVETLEAKGFVHTEELNWETRYGKNYIAMSYGGQAVLTMERFSVEHQSSYSAYPSFNYFYRVALTGPRKAKLLVVSELQKIHDRNMEIVNLARAHLRRLDRY